VAVPYNVQLGTVLTFDFESSDEGEIHGIGFDTNDVIDPTQTFQLHGTQTWGIQAFNDYAGETPKSYSISVGSYFTGNMLYLIFANDSDPSTGGSPTAESVFSNITITGP